MNQALGVNGAPTSETRSPSGQYQVLVVGAGFAGVCAGIKLREAGIKDFVICEKASGIGGTWWHNTYPGAACDIPSHLYCYSFEPNPNWTRKFAPQPEIQAYIEHCVDKYALRKHIHLNTPAAALQWDESHGFWITRLENGNKIRSRHVIFASGGLHLPAFPDIPGRVGFKGPAMHSAQWDHTVDFSGKRVAVIGSAASAIQLIPELAKIAAQVDIYQRTPNYIAPRMDRAFTEQEKKRFARWPALSRWYRRLLFLRGEYLLFPVVKTKRRSRWRERIQGMIRNHIKSSVADPALAQKLTPEYALGCKRILIADNYYSALNRRNVQLYTDGIDHIDDHAIVSKNGRTSVTDIIVYATGFDIEQYMRAVDVTGRKGRRLSEYWANIPRAYKGGFVPGFPNFYMTTGPNTGVGTTSVVYMIEAQMQLIMQAIEGSDETRAIEVTEEACDRYNAKIRNALQQTIWAGDCESWYKRADGEISTLYPFNARSYLQDHKQLAVEDFQWLPVPVTEPENTPP